MNKLNSFKFRVQRLLEARGFTVAPIADPGLPIDLIAIRPDRVRGYRCKGHGHIYESELSRLQAFARKSGLEVLIAKEHPGREIYFQKIPPFRDDWAREEKEK